MKTYMHGTDYESAMNILKNGLSSAKETVWTCSNPRMIYCRDAEDEDAQWLSIESGQIASAYKDLKVTEVCILRILIPDNIAEEIVEDDNSVPDKRMYGCYQIDIDVLNDYIRNGDVKLYVDIYSNAYVPYLRPFYLAYLNTEIIQFNDKLLTQAIEVIKSSNISMFDEILSYDDIIETREYTKKSMSLRSYMKNVS